MPKSNLIHHVFNNLKILDCPWNEVDTIVAAIMSSYWTNFTKKCDPNGEGLPAWTPTDSCKYVSNEALQEYGNDPCNYQ